ncbi:hypothetical protein BDF20DRAFT_870179 [Mycotypha africana]|uniref:uncharacterized protein n=1 Tax=Mycotypha africana TaxID=64632 RepID=UPI0023016EF7|nr:uncharacterized protein BDF20DRAFT_870179 [Mycotypha africana]KAI8979535.1 hypothetical protein BDF20DRAFT_870179 [Mycotypha africana]
MVKKMRYYARFIIVCFLLNKDENVRQLIAELEGLIEEYAKCFKPPDAKEWQLVLEEIVTFTEAEKKLVPINLDRTPGKIEHRLPAVIPERNIGAGIPKLKLQEAILVGNYDKQLKFSELTLDMYRMLQSLEREPSTSHPSVAATTSKVDAASSNKKDTTTSSKEDAFNTSTAKAAFSSSNAVNVSNAAEKSVRRSNPHKYLLYRPSLSQLMVYISTAFKDTNDNSALFLYLSADGYSNDTEQVIPGYRGGVLTSARTINKGSTASERTVANNPTSNQPSTTTGGIGTASSSTTTTTNNNNSTSAAGSNSNATSSVITNNNTSAQNNNVGGSTSTSNSINNTAATAGTTATAIGSGRNMEHSIHPPSAHCLHPADLIPFTRKPLFLIVDSEKSTQFRNMPNVFDQPVMCLMSPVEYPSSVQDKCEIGSLFTLFLHTPVLGFCSISDIGNLDQQKWDECVRKISAMEKTIGDQLLVDSNVDTNIKRFMSDDFLYYFIVRFVLCGIFLRYHSSFKDEKSFPSSLPHLPETIYVSTDIVTMLAELTAIADVGTYFSLPTYATVSVTANVSSTSPPPAPASVSSNTNNNTGGSVGMPSSPPLNAAAPTDF